MESFLVLSDVHESKKELKNFLLKYQKDFSGVFFAGDGLKSFEDLSFHLPIYKVKGNCDFFPHLDDPLELYLSVENIKIWLLHGHQYSVKSGLDKLIFQAINNNQQIVIFGHTHLPYKKEHQGIWFFNPGSFAQGSYGILRVEKENFYLELQNF